VTARKPLDGRIALGLPAMLGALSGIISACGDDSSTTPTADAGADAASDANTVTDTRPDSVVPVTIGEGFKPGVAVDPAGTAYIAWYGTETVTTTLQFCRLPRGATACDVRKPITALGTTLTRPFVTVTGSMVRVISYRYGLTGDRFDAVYVHTSIDGGTSFDAGRPFGSVPYSDATNGPGEAISFATNAYTFGEVYEHAPSNGTAPPAQRAILSTDHPYSGTVALLDANTPVVAFADGSGNAQFRRYNGTGDPNSESSWAAPKDIGHDEYVHLASGPSGLFLKGKTAASTLEVRRFDGTTFAPGVTVPDGNGELPQSHLAEDAAGRLHLVWPRIAADGIRVYYATSDDGVTWQSHVMVTSPDVAGSMRVATAPDHIGIAAWEGPNASVRVIPVGPSAGR